MWVFELFLCGLFGVKLDVAEPVSFLWESDFYDFVFAGEYWEDITLFPILGNSFDEDGWLTVDMQFFSCAGEDLLVDFVFILLPLSFQTILFIWILLWFCNNLKRRHDLFFSDLFLLISSIIRETFDLSYTWFSDENVGDFFIFLGNLKAKLFTLELDLIIHCSVNWYQMII